MHRVPSNAGLTALIGLLVAFAASGTAFAQGARAGAPQDWSQRHILYTNPDTRDEAASKGVLALERWKQKHKDPRFAQQVARKMRFIQPTANNAFSGRQLEWANRFRRQPAQSGPVQRDWSNVMGGAGGAVRSGVYPAKFSFDIDATPSCVDDFVVYTTGGAGATGSGVFASQTGTFSGNPGNGDTVTIRRTGAPDLVLTASTTLNSGLNFQRGSATLAATNLADAINRNGGTAGVTATSSGATITLKSVSPGTASNSVALSDSNNKFSWTNNTLRNGTGTAGQPTIIAFNQLYKATCAATSAQPVPSTLWSYNTGNGAVADLSPVISLDGSQVAFVQRTANVASLVLVKWSGTSSGTVGAPVAPASVTAANYRSCTAPCMTTIAFSGNPNNTNSSPFYVYFADVLYVGADNGTLHRFTGLFDGTPAEQTSGGFPATVSSGNRLTSPVYDSDSGLVFVGSDFASGATTIGGRLHSVDSAGAVVSTTQLARFRTTVDNTITSGLRDAPIVDTLAGRVYAFAESGLSLDCSTAECKTVYQFSVPFASNATWNSKAQVGRGQKWYRALYGGTFDNVYYTSADSTSPTGGLYVCGSASDGTVSQRPTLWRIPITGNVMGTAQPGPLLVSGDSGDCSPVTEILNGAEDYLFVSTNQSITDPGNAQAPVLGGCGTAGTCTVYMIDLTGRTWNTTTPADASLKTTAGTSGIIVDNISAVAGTSQIYFSGLASPGNAVQASQAGLQ